MFRRVITVLIFVLAISLVSVSQETPGGRSLGTTYLPLDHWAYPVVERAIRSGALPNTFVGQRPWTRIAIAQLLVERRRHPDAFTSDAEAVSMIVSLENEFAPELSQIGGDKVADAQIEELYGRVQGISGTPIRDSYHIGQSFVNDFGRPYGEGGNGIAGGIARADYEAFGFELRGEFQHGAGIPPYSPSVTAALAANDRVPTPIGPDNHELSRGSLLDSYVSATWRRLVFSFGRESQWWGPGDSSAMLFTNNIQPMTMFKVDLAEPVVLPSILKYLGPLRLQFFNAKTQGHYYPAQAYLHGEKVSIMPTKNLELGFTRTTVWAGVGHPITAHSLFKTYFSVGDQPSSDLPQFDPGDRRGGLDVNYKVPFLRNWLSVYMDSFVDDDPSPLAAPNRTAFHPGFYVTHLPGLPKLDLRAEAAYTQLPTEPNYFGYFFYTNGIYKDGYTNNGLLIGDWVGREGKGGELTSTYWLTPDRTIQAYWRNHMVAPDFIPGGAHQNDVGANINFAIGSHLHALANVQYENYDIPILAAGHKNDTSVALTLSYWPHRSGAATPK